MYSRSECAKLTFQALALGQGKVPLSLFVFHILASSHVYSKFQADLFTGGALQAAMAFQTFLLSSFAKNIQHFANN